MAAWKHSQISPRTVWTVGLHGFLVVLLGLTLLRLGTVFEWMGLVLLLALALDPAVSGLQRLGLKRGWAVLAVMLGLVGLLLLLAATLLPMFVSQARSLAMALPGLVQDLGQMRWVRWADEHLGLVERLEGEVRARAAGVAGSAVEVVTSAVGMVAGGVAILSLTIFALLSGADLYESALDWLDPEDRPRVEALVTRMRKAVGGYVAGTFLVASIGALVTATTLLLLGVPYFLPLGLSYLVLGIVPFVGSAVMAVLVSVTTLLTVGMQKALIALAIFLVYQQVEGNVLGPVVQRHTIQMNPLLIGLVLLLGAGVAGLLGAVMALPVAAAVQVFLRDMHARRMQQRARLPEGGGGGRGAGPARGPAEGVLHEPPSSPH